MVIEIFDFSLSIFLFTVSDHSEYNFVHFGTTVSINKKGRLASCSNLEWTKGRFQIKFDRNTGEWVLLEGKDGNLKPIEIHKVYEQQFGKCYKKDKNDDKFSFLLENFFKNIYNPDGKYTLKIYTSI